MQLQIHRTEMLSATAYVDLQTLNGKLHTVLFKKVGEPNMFKDVQILNGDQVDKVVKANRK